MGSIVGLGGPVGSCWEQETGADMAAWCIRRLKWDETTWPPEEPINYTKSPATVKLLTARLWQISEECLDPEQHPSPIFFFFFSCTVRVWIKLMMMKLNEKTQKSWNVCCLAIRLHFPPRHIMLHRHIRDIKSVCVCVRVRDWQLLGGFSAGIFLRVLWSSSWDVRHANVTANYASVWNWPETHKHTHTDTQQHLRD